MKTDYSIDAETAKRIDDHVRSFRTPTRNLLQDSLAVILHFVLKEKRNLRCAYSFLKTQNLTCSYQYFCRWVKNNIEFDDYEVVAGTVIRVDNQTANSATRNENNAYQKTLAKVAEARKEIEIGALKAREDRNEEEAKESENTANNKLDVEIKKAEDRQKLLVKVAETRKKMDASFGMNAGQLIKNAINQKR